MAGGRAGNTSFKSFQTTPNKIKADGQAKPTQMVLAEAELLHSEASAEAQGSRSSCPSGDRRCWPFLLSTLCRAPLTRGERNGSGVEEPLSPSLLSPPPRCMAPLNRFPTLREGGLGEKSCPGASGCLTSPSSCKSQLLSDSSQNVSIAACQPWLQPPRSSLASPSFGAALKGGIYLYLRREAPCAALALRK